MEHVLRRCEGLLRRSTFNSCSVPDSDLCLLLVNTAESHFLLLLSLWLLLSLILVTYIVFKTLWFVQDEILIL